MSDDVQREPRKYKPRIKDTPSTLLSPEAVFKIKAREAKREAERIARNEAKAVLRSRSDAPACAIKPGETRNPLGKGISAGHKKRKLVYEALEKIIAKAKHVDTSDPEVTNRLDALMKKIFLMAMDEGAKLEQVLEAAKFISERLDGKPTQEIDETGGGHGPLIINIGTRFGAAAPEHVSVTSNG